MAGVFEYEMFWEGDAIGRLVSAEPDVPYVEGVWVPNGSIAASRFDDELKNVFRTTDTVHWTHAPRVELLHSNGHRSKGLVTGFDKDGLLIRW